MIKAKKVTLLLIGVIVLLSMNYVSADALPIDTVPILEEIDLPSDLDFSVSNTCSGHAYFMQAAANEDGCFAVYSRHVTSGDYSKVDFKRVYIDVYNSEGALLQELSFTTSLDLALEYEDNAVKMFFYNSVLIYDLTTQELLHYAIPEGSAVNGGMYKHLRSKEFSAGNWVYSLENGFNGYVKLVRSDGKQVQVLVEMPGTGELLWKVILPGGIIGIIGMILIVWQIKKKRDRESKTD